MTDNSKLIAMAREPEVGDQAEAAGKYRALSVLLADALEVAVRERDWHREQEAGLRDDIDNLEQERDEFKRLFTECHPVHLDGLRRAESAESIVDAVIEKHGQQVSTHYDGCHEDHVACLAVALKQRLAPDRPREDAAEVSAR